MSSQKKLHILSCLCCPVKCLMDIYVASESIISVTCYERLMEKSIIGAEMNFPRFSLVLARCLLETSQMRLLNLRAFSWWEALSELRGKGGFSVVEDWDSQFSYVKDLVPHISACLPHTCSIFTHISAYSAYLPHISNVLVLFCISRYFQTLIL